LIGAVADDHAAGVVIDGFAGSIEESGGEIVVVEDKLGIGFGALQGDAYGHLADGAAGEVGGAGEGLGAEQDVQSKGAALPDQLLEDNGGILSELVVFGEKHLKFIDDEDGARQLGAGRLAVGGDILDAGLAEEIAAAGQLGVEPPQDAEAELAVAFDGDGAGVDEPVADVGFEFDAFFEVDEVQFDLVGGLPQRQVGDNDMQ